MPVFRAASILAAVFASALSVPALAAGNVERGAALFRACAACHSLRPGRNMTGPSLAGVWERKAGGLDSFERYSPALKSSGIVWDEKTLDAWLKSPQSLVPHNRMTFPVVPDAQQRADLIAFLKEASAGHATLATTRGFRNLKKLGADHQVTAIRYCHDTYRVTTADGQTADFWEANLRFKTDSSDTGPRPGKPAILPAGMSGDRASVFFAAPDEISSFIKGECRKEQDR
ncbi:MAG: c-type cytochrome [Thiohalocapsa sp.]